ncbi:uncharacterized protein LOC108332827 [Vigna angularis]|uniref:uncharacterized protein LOC108332827 n=1 Tax=Phaseolus angularis TaxID=3914 RepID=UPI00080A12D7|nr:uncharacterized protein LOC108332827 [Vigna angularis]
MADYKWEVGTLFIDKNDFKEAIRSYVVHTGRALKFVKNDKCRVRVRCMGGQGCKDNYVSCRPTICLDGCFLKGQYEGELLITIGRDPNDQMLSLAYAGLMPVVQELLPEADQRFCMRHLYANFGKRFLGQMLRSLMWRAATSTYPQAWEKEMLNIKEVNIEAYKYLIVIPPRYWSTSRFTTQVVCDSLDNNISEAFNSVIVLARGKPMITMLKEIKLYLMKRWATNRSKIASMDFNICPKIKNMLMKETNLSRYWIPRQKLFEVRHTIVMANKFTVDLESQHCSCRKWMISGISCCHAIATMNYSNEDPQNFMPSWFTRSTYEETYASIIYPVNGQFLWERTSYVDVLPAIMRKLSGRSKKKRMLEAWKLTKDATQMRVGGHRKKCTICRHLGHNKKKCPLHPDITQPTCHLASQ